MAFATAPGWGQFPNGNFSPVLYSKAVQLAYRTKSVCNEITNTDYINEISAMGDTVRIIKEPEITVSEYKRGTQIQAQDLDDEDFSLVIDKANYFAFKLDDVEEAFTHVDWKPVGADRAAYQLADQMDKEVLGYLSGYKQSALSTVADTVNDQVNGTVAVDTAGTDELLTSMKLIKGSFGNITTASAGDHSIPLAARLPGQTAMPTATASPHMVVAKMSYKLNSQDVPYEGRWLVISPEIMELLQDEDSRFLNADFGENGGLRNGLVMKNWNGFRVYLSNNLPSVGTGPATSGTANQNSNYGVIVAGHDSAVASAQRVNKSQTYQDPDSFAEIIRGMQLYGRKQKAA